VDYLSGVINPQKWTLKEDRPYLPFRKYTLPASNVFVIPQTQIVRECPETPYGKDEFMRNRNVHIQFWLNEKEAERFNKSVKRSGLSREAYLRQLIDGYLPTDMPPPDYFAMMKELHYIGVNLNQIAQKAHMLNALDVKRYDESVAMLNRSVVNIVNAVMLPRKVEKNEPTVDKGQGQ